MHSYNRNGLCVVGFMDDHYPVRSAFSVLNKVKDHITSVLRLNGVLVFKKDPGDLFVVIR